MVKKCELRCDIISSHKDKNRDELIDELVDRILEIEKLKRKLRRYENPHTPPSRDERKSKHKKTAPSGLGVGKKSGYKGRTKILGDPTDFINHFDGTCSQCGKHNAPKDTCARVYEEIPKPQPTRIVEAKWGLYECECGHCWESTPKDVPHKGQLGKNALAHITLLRFDDRLPLRKTVSALKRQFRLALTSKAIYDVTMRVADKITPEYDEIRKKIRKASHLHIDETKIKIQGKWYYVWIFRSTRFVFYCIRKERNRKVLDEILGYNYSGCIICDGLSAYKEYTKYLQRCWAHILRETKELAEKSKEGELLHNWMKELFIKVKAASVKDPPDIRKKNHDICIEEMKRLIATYSPNKQLKKVITTIKNGLPFWFTRILHPRIEPTNNNAEQPLREIVVIKKIIGTLRNTDGAAVMEKIMTLLATWKMQDKDSFCELRSLL